MEDKRKELEKLKDELRKKEKEATKTRRKVKNIERKLSGARRRRPRNRIGEMTKDDVLLVEECGDGDQVRMDLYKRKNGHFEYLTSIPTKFDKRGRRKSHLGIPRSADEGALRFLEEEVEPVEDHYHGDGLDHRIYELTDRDLVAFVRLVEDDELSRVYSEEGWEGVEELYKTLWNELKKSCPEFTGRRRRRHLHETLKERILEYAEENDLTPREAVTALKLEDQRFAERCEENKQLIRTRINEIEKTFFPHLPTHRKLKEKIESRSG